MNHEELHSYVNKMKYLVIYPNKTYFLYSSLRKIGTDIEIDSSTISKNLKDDGYCYCFSRNTNLLYYIRKI